MNVQYNVCAASLTSMEVGGYLAAYAEVSTTDELLECLDLADQLNVPFYIIGSGTNIVFSDASHRLFIIRLLDKGIRVARDANSAMVSVNAGTPWAQVVRYAVARHYTGIECLAGIPGTAGAVPVQNVGAYGQDVGQVITHIEAIDLSTRSEVTIESEQCEFKYRSSNFNTVWLNRYCVRSVTLNLLAAGSCEVSHPEVLLELRHGSSRSPREVAEAVVRIRRRKGTSFRNWNKRRRTAGSFFKNPTVGRAVARDIAMYRGDTIPAGDGDSVRIPAAWLMELAGFQKGYTLARARLSPDHILSIENVGQATAAEIEALALLVQSQVLTMFGILLEAEPTLIGFAGFPAPPPICV